MDKSKLLKLRKKINKKKPNFVSQDTHKRKRIRKRWKKPRGWQSKIRLNKRGYRKMVTPGYGSPKEVYDLHPKGLKPIRIFSESDFEKVKKDINKEKQGIVIASSVGTKKRISLIKKAQQEGIKILNIKNPGSFVEKIKKEREKKKQEKIQKEEKKKKEEEKRKKKAKQEKEKSELEKLSEEEKKKIKKKEKDKILTKKEK